MEKVKPHEIRNIVEPRMEELFSGKGFKLNLREDGTTSRLQIVDPNTERIWVNYSLRDRSNDGPTWRASKLSSWPARGVHDVHPYGTAVEESKYWLDPRSPLSEVFSPEESVFIENPFELIPFDDPQPDKLMKWYTMWRELMNNPHTPYPGYYALSTIGGATRGIFEDTLILLGKKGYTHLTSVPTWFHVAQLNEHLGFDYTHEEDGSQMKAFTSAIEPAAATIDSPISDRRIVTSWNAVLHYWAEVAEKEGLDPESFVTPGSIARSVTGDVLTYPLRPEYNIWQNIEAA